MEDPVAAVICQVTANSGAAATSVLRPFLAAFLQPPLANAPLCSTAPPQIFLLQDKVDSIITADNDLSSLLSQLETCSYTSKSFHRLLEQIQRVVDALNLRSFANLGDWVAKVDSEVERRLSVRLEKALGSWRVALERYGTDNPMMSRARGWYFDWAVFVLGRCDAWGFCQSFSAM